MQIAVAAVRALTTEWRKTDNLRAWVQESASRPT
jgi:hypothetical protein